MSEEKTKITHSQDKARFLGYDITTAKNSALMYDSKHQLRKTHTGRIKLYAPRDKWQAKLIEYGALRIRYDENGKEIWDSHHRGNMVHMTDVEIVSQVNAEIRGMYNYYSIAENATVIKNFAFILEYSMYKTFGLKYQKSVYKIQRKYRRNGIFMVPYNTKKGLKYCEFYHDGFKKKRYACSFEPDLLPQYVKYDYPNYLNSSLEIDYMNLSDFTNQRGNWTQIYRITPDDTGYPRNHNATLLRDNFGHLQDWEEPEFYFTVSKAAPDVQPSGSNHAEWTYHIWKSKVVK